MRILWAQACLRKLWPELALDLPDCQRLPWTADPLSLEERLMAKPSAPILIGESRAVPPWVPLKLKWRALDAARHAIESLRIFRRSLFGRFALTASGTTVLGTETFKDPEPPGIYAVPLNAGETFRTYLRRAKEYRGLRRHPLTQLAFRRALHARPKPVPPPQAVVSVVAGYGIERPWSAVGASGGPIPIGICVGTREIAFTFDHRLWNATDCGHFYDRFFERFFAEE